MITYEEFLANVNEDDLGMLTTFAQGNRAITRNAQEAEALFTQATRLFTAGMVWRVVRGYEQKSDGVEYQFDGYLSPVAFGYVAKAARERVMISRDPLPTPVQE
jgi:hypothetical protein